MASWRDNLLFLPNLLWFFFVHILFFATLKYYLLVITFW
jgi:hypothetical protein